MEIVKDFKDYELIDASNGMKYERWKDIFLLRPDPLIIWDNGHLEVSDYPIDSLYIRSDKGGGYWENKRKIPTSWTIDYKELKFNIKQMGFKHTGLFPEQAVNWDMMMKKIKDANRPIKVLNLFAYTGGATIASLKAGASVVHVDSSHGMVDWAKENVILNNLDKKDIRYIVDDAPKFVKREIRRENKYDVIIMDPPSYGKGPNKEIWDLEKDLYPLIKDCMDLLSDKPLFFLVNSYSGLSPTILENILKQTNKKDNSKIIIDEIGLPITKNNLILPCGIYGRIDYE